MFLPDLGIGFLKALRIGRRFDERKPKWVGDFGVFERKLLVGLNQPCVVFNPLYVAIEPVNRIGNAAYNMQNRARLVLAR